MLNIIGEGARGTVYKCTRGSLQFAIKKTYRVSRNSPSTEVDAMIRLSGTNYVVQIYAAWYEESSEFSHSYIAMELFERYLVKLKLTHCLIKIIICCRVMFFVLLIDEKSDFYLSGH